MTAVTMKWFWAGPQRPRASLSPNIVHEIFNVVVTVVTFFLNGLLRGSKCLDHFLPIINI
jgi:hypothetical protein